MPLEFFLSILQHYLKNLIQKKLKLVRPLRFLLPVQQQSFQQALFQQQQKGFMNNLDLHDTTLCSSVRFNETSISIRRKRRFFLPLISVMGCVHLISASLYWWAWRGALWIFFFVCMFFSFCFIR